MSKIIPLQEFLDRRAKFCADYAKQHPGDEAAEQLAAAAKAAADANRAQSDSKK